MGEGGTVTVPHSFIESLNVVGRPTHKDTHNESQTHTYANTLTHMDRHTHTHTHKETNTHTHKETNT